MSMKMRFQWFFDIATTADAMQIVTVSAGGDLVRKRLWPQFAAHKYWKLGSVSLKLCPASTLPVDPTGLSYEAGETTVDPRDQLNPGLVRITNGEDVFEDLTGVSSDKQRAMYYSMMLDTRWYKWSLQSGCKRTARPMYWQIGQLHQDFYPGAVTNVPVLSGGTVYSTATHYDESGTDGSSSPGIALENSDPHGIFQTGHKGRLGWMPTDGIVHTQYTGETVLDQTHVNDACLAPIPSIEVFKIILPPAYKTKYYYRAYVTETVYFAGPIVNNAVELSGQYGPQSYRSLDVFHTPTGSPEMPTTGYSLTNYARPQPPNDGSDV